MYHTDIKGEVHLQRTRTDRIPTTVFAFAFCTFCTHTGLEPTSNDVGPELLRQITLYSKLACDGHDHPPRTFSKTVLIWSVWRRWVESDSLHCDDVLPL